MYRGTTPTLSLSVAGIDLSAMRCYLTIRSAGLAIEFDSGNGDFNVSYADNASTFTVTLTQAQTLALQPGEARVQVRYVSASGTAGVTDETVVPVQNIVQGGVISYA